MIGSSRSRRRTNDDVDLDMVPIMNMFLVLIPFLLMSASFFHLRAINTSVPVLGDTKAVEGRASDIRLTVIVELEEKGVHLSVMSAEVEQGVADAMERYIQKTDEYKYPLDDLSSNLKAIKAQYPLSDTLIIIPDPSVIYETIIQAMDVARYSDDSKLFPNVVLSGKVG